MTQSIQPKRSCLMTILKVIVSILIIVPLLVYVAYAIFFYNIQRQALFPGQDRPIQISDPATSGVQGLTAAHFDTSLGQDAGFAWYIPPISDTNIKSPVVIVGHGNGEIADDWISLAQPLQVKGYAVLILGYPGYGHAPGSPSQESIEEAALGAYDWLIERPEIDSNQIIIFGHSVGGAATLAIVDQRPTKGVILLSAFASIKHIARDRFLPWFLAKDRFDNVAILEKYDRPVYLMHGTQDIVVFPYQADLLHAATPNSQLKWLPCGHGGCIGDVYQFWEELDPIMKEMIRD